MTTTKIDTSSPVKIRGKGNTNNQLSVPKVGSFTQSSSKGFQQTVASGMSTQTETNLLPPPKKTVRAKSKDLLASLEKRESIDEIAKRKQFEEKMQLITSEIKGMSKNSVSKSNRFKDAMTRVTDLLKVNQMLRDETNGKEDIIRGKNVEIFEIKEENEELRDKIELMETIIQANSDTFEQYASSQLLQEAEKTDNNYMGFEEGRVQIDSVYVELLELRRICKKLETRNKFLEKQNMENQYQMHFIGNNEPSRPIMKGKSNKKDSNPPHPKALSKHNSVPSLVEPRAPAFNNKIGKKSKINKKLTNYKQISDDDFFASSALVRNGDYAMDTWQKVELNYHKHKSPSPIIALSSSGFSSERDNK